MKRFIFLLRHEILLVKSTWLIHFIVLLQPAIMFYLMSTVMVNPTFTMHVLDNGNPELGMFIKEMESVGSPIGLPYIDPVLTSEETPVGIEQVISLEGSGEQLKAIQTFNSIDSNLVKNFRNRLHSTTLRIWNQSLGSKAVKIREHPLLDRDLPYNFYFGLAVLPLTAMMASSITGALLTALDFESGIILENRLSPQSSLLILVIRLIRLILTSLIACLLVYFLILWITGIHVERPWDALVILCLCAICGGSIGITAGLLLKRSLPGFVVGLTSSLGLWLLGGAFGLPASFSNTYWAISRLSLNSYSIEILFKDFINLNVGNPAVSWLMLLVFASIFVFILQIFYRRTVMKAGK
ncbi:MAG: ABC transporter permease [Anaerolineales bacterium]|nr:ABC transporter permease [Anaerolineales bacterium]